MLANNKNIRKARSFAHALATEPDRQLVLGLVIGAAYLFYFMPGSFTAACFAGAILSSLKLFALALNVFAGVNVNLRWTHVLVAVVGVTVAAEALHAGPALAQFFQSLEEAAVTVIADGDTGIDEDFVRNLFLFLRVIFILAFLAGVIAVFVQAFQGNNWQPILQVLIVGVAFVIGVELISRLILGDLAGG